MTCKDGPVCPVDPALRELAARLLTGTGLSPEVALEVASGRVVVPGPVAAALLDGWTAADPGEGSL